VSLPRTAKVHAMLQPLRLGSLEDVKASYLVPPIVQPLLRAAQRGEDVAPIVLGIAKGFGFDGFLYGGSFSLQPRQETRQFVYSTWPEELIRLYDERAYIEVDPRIQDVLSSVLPLVWDQSTYRGRSAAVDGFLDVIQAYGVASGVMCSLRDNRGRVGALSLSCNLPILDEVRRLMIGQHMGDILMFERYFHELFVSGVLNALVPPHLEGARLSSRERECLTMAARGLTGEDIAFKLSISSRTVQHHFDSIRSKLGAANRQEAIARGLQVGIIGP
jgi:DNA-binding CsgD family transcriptional regulator